jgi:hypothetical protein
MDPATVVRDDLRSYALRRCIRFYTAVVVLAIVVVGGQMLDDRAATDRVLAFGALLFVVLAVVEVAAGTVMLQMAKVRSGLPGPESPLWLFAQGAGPSWIAALLFLGVAAVLFVATRL